ncbi:MAG: isochorismatase family cysteine hydrolase [Cyclobacteriaceae bacterium]
MDTIEKEKTLAVIDVQQGFISSVSAHVPSRIRKLIDRVDFTHRIFTRFNNTSNSQYEKLLGWTKLKHKSETDIVTDLQNKATITIDKYVYSSLTPEFLEYLNTHTIREIYLAGIDTDICVLKTAVDLFEHGFRPIVLADCCMSHADISYHQKALDILPRFIGREQIVYDSAEYFRSCFS